MNTKNLLIASVIGAVVTTVLSNIPLLICLLCLPLWSGPLLATWIYKRQNGTMVMNQALSAGTLSGVFASVLGFIIGLTIGPAASATMLTQLQQYLPAGNVPPVTSGPSISLLLVGVVFTIIFGVVGGLIGGALFKDKPASTAPLP